MASDLLGYLRDFVVAVIGVCVLFGLSISNQQIAGILLVLSTGFALGSYLYTRYKAGDGTPAGSSK